MDEGHEEGEGPTLTDSRCFWSVNGGGVCEVFLTQDVEHELSMVHTGMDICVADCAEKVRYVLPNARFSTYTTKKKVNVIRSGVFRSFFHVA